MEQKSKGLEIAKKFANKVLEKHKDRIKAIVVMGSAARGEMRPSSDIDVFVILDDVTQEITPELQDEIDDDLEKIAKNIPEAMRVEKIGGREEKTCILSIQPTYTLTEFWDYARIGHPIIYNFIKEGIAVYDTGFFTPVKKLLKMGKISATREAIESYMEGAPKKLMRAKTVKLLMLAEDCYYAMLNTAQAILMFIGLEPPVPSKAYDEVKKHLVDPGILEPEYAEWLREIIEIRKRIEHKELLDVSGAFVDEWIRKAEKFVAKMFALLNALEIRKREKILERTHEILQKAVITVLKSLKKEFKQENLMDVFKREFVETGRVGNYYLDVWKRIEELKGFAARREFDKIPAEEVYTLREYVRKLIHDLAKILKAEKKEELKEAKPN